MARMSRVIIILLAILFLAVPLNLVHAAAATVQIIPSTTAVDTGESFTVNLTVTGVTNLAVWEFRLFYLNSVLNCIGADEGPFLEEGGNSQYFTLNITNSYNATYGCVLLGSTLIGAVPGVNGTGTLATVTFQAMSSGDTPLHFDNDPIWNFLLDSTPPPRNPIPYTTVDGAVQVVQVTATHDVAVTNVTSGKTVIGQGYSGNITATVANLGGYTETFNVTVYANATVVASQNVTLSNGDSTNITFTWNTAGFAYGTYIVSTYAWPVPGETDLANNNFTCGVVTVSIPGDVEGIFRVNMGNIVDILRAFGSTIGMPNYAANCDIANDGRIDMGDIVIALRNFGQRYP